MNATNEKFLSKEMVKHKNFFMVSNRIFEFDLKPKDFTVYCCLVRHCDNEDYFFPVGMFGILLSTIITIRFTPKATNSLPLKICSMSGMPGIQARKSVRCLRQKQSAAKESEPRFLTVTNGIPKRKDICL